MNDFGKLFDLFFQDCDVPFPLMEIDSNKFAPIFYENDKDFNEFENLFEEKEVLNKISESDFISINYEKEIPRDDDFVDMILNAIEE